MRYLYFINLIERSPSCYLMSNGVGKLSTMFYNHIYNICSLSGKGSRDGKDEITKTTIGAIKMFPSIGSKFVS